MKYIKEFFLIIMISFLGEICKTVLPFPLPASIYGLVILFLLLCFHIIDLKQIEHTAVFFIEIMPLLFIPAGVGLITSWNQLKEILIPVIIITVISTIIVMAVTGRVTQAVLYITEKKKLKSKEQT